MKQREPVTTLLLAIFMPFYAQYWVYKTANEVRATQKATHMPKGIHIILPAICIFIVWPISILVSFALPATGASEESFNKTSIYVIVISLFLSLLIIGLLIANVVITYRFCRAIVKVVDVSLSCGILTLLFYAFAPIVVYLVQEELNHLPPSNIQNPVASPIQPIT